jgi:hypothetical protein
MARFKNRVSGVVVSVDEEAAMRLPDTWEPLDEEPTKAAKKTTTRKRTSSRQKAEPTPAPAETDDE